MTVHSSICHRAFAQCTQVLIKYLSGSYPCHHLEVLFAVMLLQCVYFEIRDEVSVDA